jgi:pyruvate,water dikinase
VEPLGNTTDPTILWLDRIQTEDAPQVGLKAALLGELCAGAVAVPEGFVVTAHAYRAAMAAAGIGSVLEFPVGLCGDARAEGRFRTGLVSQVEVPPEVAHAIAEAYVELSQRLARPNPLVAVRASVIDDEPTFGPTAPALVGVVGIDAVLEGVRTCWRALFNEQAMVIRAATRHAVEPVMAVIVQELVPLTRSGTAYTTDPVRRRDDVVGITAAYDDDDPRRRVRPPADTYVVSRWSHELVELRVAEKATARPYQRVLSDDDAASPRLSYGYRLCRILRRLVHP